MKRVLLLLFSVYYSIETSQFSSSSSSSNSASSSLNISSSDTTDDYDKYIRILITLTKGLDIQKKTFPRELLSYDDQCASYGKRGDHNPVLLEEFQNALKAKHGQWNQALCREWALLAD
jgi:hypothetical protein